MVTVRVISKSSGKAVKGKEVMVDFDGFGRGHKSGFTDDNGEAHLDVSPGSGKVFVDGRSVFNGTIAGRVIVYA